MGPRYPAGPRPGVRMPQMGNDFNGVNIKIWIYTSYSLVYTIYKFMLLAETICYCFYLNQIINNVIIR